MLVTIPTSPMQSPLWPSLEFVVFEQMIVGELNEANEYGVRMPLVVLIYR